MPPTNGMMATAAASSSSSPAIIPTGVQKARYKTMYACEDRQLTMDCDYGSKINLIRANFGRFSIAQCNEQGQLDMSTDCMSPITFRIMRERCQDEQKCSVNATSLIFGDRCPKTRKYLEVHFQCQPDPRVSLAMANNGGFDAPERVDLRNSSQLAAAAAGGIQPSSLSVPNLQATQSVVPNSQQHPSSSSQAFIPQISVASGSSSVLPANNPAIMQMHHQIRQQHHQPSMVTPNFQPNQGFPEEFAGNRQHHHQQQLPMTVVNSEIMSYNQASNSEIALSKLQDSMNNRDQPIIVTMRHTHVDNMSNPKCVLWDQAASQWIEQGSQIIETNSTHTICAFDRATLYLLTMDYTASPSPSPSAAATMSHQSLAPTVSVTPLLFSKLLPTLIPRISAAPSSV